MILKGTFSALFLDRDGIVNFDNGFVWKKEEFIFQEKIFIQRADHSGAPQYSIIRQIL